MDPRLEVYESPEVMTYFIDAPGVRPDDISAELGLKDGIPALMLHIERRLMDAPGKRIESTVRRRKVEAILRLPLDLDPKRPPETTLAYGVLKVSVPRSGVKVESQSIPIREAK